MNRLKHNWELKLLALALATVLWMMLYFNPPVDLFPSWGAPLSLQTDAPSSSPAVSTGTAR